MNYTIYLDMDGCCVDFVGGMAKRIKEVVQQDIDSITSPSLRRGIRKYLKTFGRSHTVTEEDLKHKAVRSLMYKLASEEGFFYNLESLQNHRLYNYITYVQDQHPTAHFALEFLTAPIGEYAERDKTRWVRDNLKNEFPVNVVPRVEKVDFCTSGNCILIDDHPDTIEQWVEAGGIGHLYVDSDEDNFQALQNLLEGLGID